MSSQRLSQRLRDPQKHTGAGVDVEAKPKSVDDV